MVFICIFVITDNVKHFFMCLFATCISSLVKCPNLSHIFYWVVCFLLIEFWEVFIYFGYKSFIKCAICKYFLTVVACLFILLTVFLIEQKKFDEVQFINYSFMKKFDEVQLINYSFMNCVFGILSEKSLPNPKFTKIF